MEVILLERVAKLGQMGEVVNVKNGYARNFLIPQGKALRSSKASLAIFEAQRAQLEARNLETKGEAEKLAETLDGQQFVIIRSASDAGSLYGSVTTRDAADAATEKGFTVDKKQVTLNAPIKELGLHALDVILHPEVTATITVNVARFDDMGAAAMDDLAEDDASPVASEETAEGGDAGEAPAEGDDEA